MVEPFPPWTANNSVPLPLRPSVFLTTMSNPPTYAVLETVMFAVRVLGFTNAVELTVTPPGFVVPLINHWACAPALKPLPPTVTSRLIVPWVAEFGTALVTEIWAGAELASKTIAVLRIARITVGRRVARRCSIFYPKRTGSNPFGSVTRTWLTVFRQASRIRGITTPDRYESSPVIWMSMSAISVQHRSLRHSKRQGWRVFGKFVIKAAHETSGRTVIDFP